MTRSLLIKLPRNAVKINLPVTLNRKVLLPCLRIAVITSARSTLLTFDTLEILKMIIFIMVNPEFKSWDFPLQSVHELKT